MPVKPPAPKYISKESGDNLFISILTPRFHFSSALIAGSIILCLTEVLFNPNWGFTQIGFGRLPITFRIMWLIFWSAWGAVGVCSFAWLAAGKETVEVTKRAVSIAKKSLGLGFRRVYLADSIKDLRISSSNTSGQTPMLVQDHLLYFFRQNRIGSLAFDYGAKTIRFGSGVEEGEAKQILAEIVQKFPQYRSTALVAS